MLAAGWQLYTKQLRIERVGCRHGPVDGEESDTIFGCGAYPVTQERVGAQPFQSPSQLVWTVGIVEDSG